MISSDATRRTWRFGAIGRLVVLESLFCRREYTANKLGISCSWRTKYIPFMGIQLDLVTHQILLKVITRPLREDEKR